MGLSTGVGMIVHGNVNSANPEIHVKHNLCGFGLFLGICISMKGKISNSFRFTFEDL
jgi:hypothetical protein